MTADWDDDITEIGHSGGADAIDIDAVRTVNREFYDAFEAQDLDRLVSVWEHSHRAQCTHPGWSILRGWPAVQSSWASLIEGPESLQFVLTNESITVVGDVAWVTLDENVLGAAGSTTVAATNLFCRGAHGWRMVAHHGSAIAPHEAI